MWLGMIGFLLHYTTGIKISRKDIRALVSRRRSVSGAFTFHAYIIASVPSQLPITSVDMSHTILCDVYLANLAGLCCGTVWLSMQHIYK